MTGYGSSPICSGVAKKQLHSDHVIKELQLRLKYCSGHLGTSSIELFPFFPQTWALQACYFFYYYRLTVRRQHNLGKNRDHIIFITWTNIP